MTTVQILPVKWKMNAPPAAHLFVKIIFDDLATNAKLLWQLIADDKRTIVDQGTITVAGTDYSNWTGDNSFPFEFTAQQLGISIPVASGYGGASLGFENI